MGRKPCCEKVGLKRGPWTIEEDHKLMSFILSNGIHCWRTVPKLAGLLRCGKSCRLRWINYLRPDLKRGGFTEAEEDQIIHLHQTLGNKWSKIASHFEGRTDNEIKNHWNTRIKKLLKEKGIDTTKSHKSADPKQTTNVVKLASEVTNSVENQYEGQFKNAENKLEGNNDKIFTNELEINNDDDLLSNYEIFSGRLEVLEHWLNEESIDIDEQSSSVVSFQDSLSASMNNEQISPGLLENPWFDEMESFFGFSGHP